VAVAAVAAVAAAAAAAADILAERRVKALSIRIEKAERRLLMITDDGGRHEYPVALGQHSAADKAVEGDLATPVGEFYVCAKNPRSKYFLSLCLSYPNAAHAARGLAAGLITEAQHDEIQAALSLGKMPPQHTALGGEIYIHGGGGLKDWTRGCIALENAAMQIVYDAAGIGTPVVIVRSQDENVLNGGAAPLQR